MLFRFLFVTFVFCSHSALATSLLILTEPLPPYQVVDENGVVTGSVTQKVRQLLDKSGFDYAIHANPWPSSYQTALTQKNVCIYSMGRVPPRENKFVWVANLKQLDAYFYSLSRKKLAVNSLEDAMSHRIAAINQDVTYFHLLSMGLVEGDNMYAVDFGKGVLSVLEKRSDDVDLVLLTDSYFERLKALDDKADMFTKHDSFVGLQADFYLACSLKTDKHITDKLTALYHVTK